MRQIRQPALRRYAGAIAKVLAYQLLSKGLLLVGLWVMRQVAGSLLWVIGRGHFDSGDMPYLMRAWQGWLLLATGLVGMTLFSLVDMSILTLLSRSVLCGERVKLGDVARQAFAALPRFLNPRGALVTLAVSFVVPLTGLRKRRGVNTKTPPASLRASGCQ